MATTTVVDDIEGQIKETQTKMDYCLGKARYHVGRASDYQQRVIIYQSRMADLLTEKTKRIHGAASFSIVPDGNHEPMSTINNQHQHQPTYNNMTDLDLDPSVPNNACNPAFQSQPSHWE